jgi:hypothetical protein
MPILNYTTEIATERTVGEIQILLARAGARSVQVDFEGGEPEAVTFMLQLGGEVVAFRVPSRWQGVLNILKKERGREMRPKYQTDAHARRVAWRIVKDWIEAQIALVQSGQATLPQLFLPHAIGKDGRTLFETVAANPHLLLGSGGQE